MNIELQPVFPQEEVDIQNYYYYLTGFSPEELEKVYKDVATLPFRKGSVGDIVGDQMETVDTTIRSSSIKWIPKTEKWSWLYTKLFNMAIEANNALWHFDLFTAIDSIQYTEYHAEEGGHYTWHQDIGPGPMSKRKVSITVQLSDSDEYEGGNLELFKGGDPEQADKAPRGKGVVFIFPSYMMHRVTPITKGTRRSFVLWVGGTHYK
jgi:PKHD-type hydroxylase